MKQFKDMRSTAGIMLRGKNVYGGGGTSPNPTGINGSTMPNMAKKLIERRKKYGLTGRS